MILSSTTKESIKTALALTVAYGIALSLDWQSPYWAGFAVAFCSLDTAGESLNKAFMRIMGTIVAIIVSLALIGLFPQDRWLFMAALITHVGFCTYMMGESRYPYFWLVSGFVVAIIASSSGMDPVNSFELAMLRFQETGLGIVVYTLVSLFLWPRLSFPAFEKSGVEITKIISSLYRLRIGLFLGEAPSVGHEVQKSQVVSTFGNFSKNLEAALTDSLEVQELSKHWRRIHSLIEQIIHILEYRQDSLLNMKNVSLAQLLPGLKEVAGELENRFNAIEQMMAGKLPRHQVQAATLAADQKELEKLSHFQRAAVVVSLERLQRLESLSRNLFQVVAEIRGFTKIQEQRVENPFIPFPLSLDMDNLAAAFRVMLGMFTAYLFWIYLDVPGGQVIVTICGSIGPAFATQPYVKIPAVFLLLLFSCFAAALIYMLLMPQLTSFIGLGIMLFGVTFSLTRLFSTPKTAGLRAITLAIFTVITGISNHQYYAFLAVANTVLILTLTCTILTIFAYIPLRPGAEHSLNRQLKRYFNSCDHLMKYREPEENLLGGFLGRLRDNFHIRQILRLPDRMGMWVAHLQPAEKTDQKAAVREMLHNLQALSYRIIELNKVRSKLRPEDSISDLKQEVDDWRYDVHRTLQQLHTDPAAISPSAFAKKQLAMMNQLDKNVEKEIDNPKGKTLSNQATEMYYLLLGGYRGVAVALSACTKSAATIDWQLFDSEEKQERR